MAYLSTQCFGERFLLALLNCSAATTGPDSEFRLSPLFVLVILPLPPPQGCYRESFHPYVLPFMCFLLPIISLLLLPLLAFVLTYKGCSLHLGLGKRDKKESCLNESLDLLQQQWDVRLPYTQKQSAFSEDPNTKYFLPTRRFLSGCPLGFVITESDSIEVFFLLCEFFQMKGNSLSAYEQNKQQSGESCCALKLSLALFWFPNCC